mgnify:CR=1 FL=1
MELARLATEATAHFCGRYSVHRRGQCCPSVGTCRYDDADGKRTDAVRPHEGIHP